MDGTIPTFSRPTGTAALADSKVVSIMEDVTLVVTDATGMMITFQLADSGILMTSKLSAIAALVPDKDQEEAITPPESVMIMMLWLSKLVNALKLNSQKTPMVKNALTTRRTPTKFAVVDTLMSSAMKVTKSANPSITETAASALKMTYLITDTKMADALDLYSSA